MGWIGTFLSSWKRIPPQRIVLVPLSRRFRHVSHYNILLQCLTLNIERLCYAPSVFATTTFVANTYDATTANNSLKLELKITPVSPKWRAAIEAQIDAERRLTIEAVRRGVKLHPGHFWDLPGTFLFLVYVMTALGFGAPVPQTLNGRSLALVYAVLAVPTHFYLMINASTCVTVHIDHCIVNIQRAVRERSWLPRRHIESPDPDCSRNSIQVVKTRPKSFRRKIWCIMSAVTFGRCVPLVSVLYYAMGALSFGWARGKEPLEIVLFPLEFTTGGGLEHVECHIRILYGFYVEGAMCLLALALTAIRRRNVAAMATMSSRYRLYESEVCDDCVQCTVHNKG